MINMIQDEEYKEIVDCILSNDTFVEQMNSVKHHDSTRLNHLIKVSYDSYKLAKALKLDYVKVARAGLLHDYYTKSVHDQKGIIDKVRLYTIDHPKEAVENAKKIMQLSEIEEDIIRSHMFPLDIKIPKYAESWVVNMVDTVISTKEFGHKFSYQLAYATNVAFLFMLNVIRIG
jgi:Predicted HD superfamily hydrolase